MISAFAFAQDSDTSAALTDYQEALRPQVPACDGLACAGRGPGGRSSAQDRPGLASGQTVTADDVEAAVAKVEAENATPDEVAQLRVRWSRSSPASASPRLAQRSDPSLTTDPDIQVVRATHPRTRTAGRLTERPPMHSIAQRAINGESIVKLVDEFYGPARAARGGWMGSSGESARDVDAVRRPDRRGSRG